MTKTLKALFIGACMVLAVILTGCIDKSDPMYVMYTYAEQNGYNSSYSTWKSEYTNGDIEFRLVNDDIEWKSVKYNSWNELYELTSSEPSWYTSLVSGDLGFEVDQFYSIIFNTNCDETVERQVVAEGEAGVIPNAITKDNYCFNGWFHGDDLFDFEAILTEGVVLEADWLIDGILVDGFELKNDIYELFVTNSTETIDFADYVSTESSFKVNGSSNTIFSLEEGDNSFTIVNAEANSNGETTFTFNVRRAMILSILYIQEFDNRDNSEIEIFVEEGNLLTMPDLAVSGYNYIVDEFDYSTTIVGDMVLTVTYTANEYTIKFAVNGGTLTDSITVKYDSVIDLPVSSKDRHEFLGWYLTGETDLVDLESFEYNIAGDITLNALWRQNEFFIDFDANGGVLPGNNPTGYDRNNSQLEIFDATRVGYTFTGWYDENDTLFTFIPENSEVDYELTAKWEANEYTITFDAAFGDAISELVVTYDDLYILPFTSRYEYTFAGWMINGEKISLNGTWTIADDVTLVADWIICDYAIFYNLNGGINDTDNPFGFDEADVLNLNDAVKVGYTFNGWYYDAEFTELFDNSKKEDINLYASFTANTYTITFDVSNGNSLNSSTLEVTYDEEFVLPITSKIQNKFIGWKLNGTIIDSGVWNIANDVVLVAYFEETEFTVSYETFDGYNSLNNQLGLDTGDKLDLTDPSEVEGYTFTGWYYDSNFENEFDDSLFEDITLYAKYTPNEYTITYNLYQDVNLDETTTAVFDAEYVLVVPTRDGFEFVQWNLEDVLFENGTWTLLEDITLVAQWNLITYTITYELNDGTNNDENPSEYTWEDTINLNDAVRQLDTFDSWTLNGEDISVIEQGSFGNIVLVANFTSAVFNLTYELNEGTLASANTATYTFEDGEVYLNRASKEGFFFSYWSLDEEGTIDGTILNQEFISLLDDLEVTLYAIYTNDAIEDIFFEDYDHTGILQTYIYYGTYPQTVVSDEEVVSQLELIINTDENGYYELDGNLYAKETALLSGNYSFSDGTKITPNNTYYFKVEPIKWRVISNTDGSVQVLSEFIIDNAQFNNTTGFDEKTELHSNDYETSIIRAFLNDSFYNMAFSSRNQSNIDDTLVVNSVETTYPYATNEDLVSNDVTDKIYILNYEDATNEDYGFDSTYGHTTTRESIVTDYAIARNCSLDDVDNGFGYWWLRTPINNSSEVLHISTYSTIQSRSVDSLIIGVRPAFTFA